MALTAGLGSFAAFALPYIPPSGTISAIQTPGMHVADGGEFTATVNGTISFQTWCIELNNTFSTTETYSYTLGQTTHNNPAGASPLKLATAWLFTQWSEGNFASGFNIGEFQAALWNFQLQGTLPSAFSAWDVTAGGSNIYVNDAITALGAGNVENASKGAYGVQVIELSPLPGDVFGGQDWLYIPDGGTTVVLLGIGLMGLVLVSRRFAIAR